MYAPAPANRNGKADVHVRPVQEEDRAFIRSLAPRLLVGYAPWRDPAPMLACMERFLMESMDGSDETHSMFLAEGEDGVRLGVVSVAHNVNFTGEEQAYIGELAVAEEAEGLGVGTVLVGRAEEWALGRGYRWIVLDTGGANLRARSFYERRGYREESVRLVKVLERQ